MALFSQMLDLSVNNAWLLYKRNCKNEKNIKRLKEFRQDIEIALACKNKSRIGRTSSAIVKELPVKKYNLTVTVRPFQKTIVDRVDYCPEFTAKGRCRFCKSCQTTVICMKCKCRLCFVEGRNCFKNFHYPK